MAAPSLSSGRLGRAALSFSLPRSASTVAPAPESVCADVGVCESVGMGAGESVRVDVGAEAPPAPRREAQPAAGKGGLSSPDGDAGEVDVVSLDDAGSDGKQASRQVGADPAGPARPHTNADTHAHTLRIVATHGGRSVRQAHLLADDDTPRASATPFAPLVIQPGEFSPHSSADPESTQSRNATPNLKLTGDGDDSAASSSSASTETSNLQHAMKIFPVVHDPNPIRRQRRRLYILCTGDTTSILGLLFHTLSTMAIFLAIGIMTAQTLPEFRLRAIRKMQGPTEDAFDACEMVIAILFTAEFFCRLISVSATTTKDRETVDDNADVDDPGVFPAPEEDEPRMTLFGHLKITAAFLVNPMTLVDLAAFVPFYIELAGHMSSGSIAAVLRVIRVTRVLQLLKFTARNAAFRVLLRTLKASTSAFVMMGGYFLLASLFFGALMFFAEAGEWDEQTGLWLRASADGTRQEASPFQSILHASYFVVITLSTTGYGDLVPTSPAGRIIAVLIMVTGMLCVAMPITIITSQFPREYAMYEAKRRERMSILQRGLGTALSGLMKQRSITGLLARRSSSASEASPASRTKADGATGSPTAQAKQHGSAADKLRHAASRVHPLRSTAAQSGDLLAEMDATTPGANRLKAVTATAGDQVSCAGCCHHESKDGMRQQTIMLQQLLGQMQALTVSIRRLDGQVQDIQAMLNGGSGVTIPNTLRATSGH